MRSRVGRLSVRRGLVLCVVVVSAIFLTHPGLSAQALLSTFARGDIFIATEESGTVEWWGPDGTLKALLVGTVPGSAEGVRLDASGNLYVNHWCGDPLCQTGNTIEVFDSTGTPRGTFGSGYNCNPSAPTFDAAGNAYVGQADCSGAVLKFVAGSQLPTSYAVAPERRGSFRVDLAPDGCTLFYTSWGPDVKRFDVCTGTQLPDFNLVPVPGGQAVGLRLLPDGGVLVAAGASIVRLDASGAQVQTYSLTTGEWQYWVGLDLVGDGTFWAVDAYWMYDTNPNSYTWPLNHTANVYKFDLATGAVLASFNTGTPVTDVVVNR